MKRGASRLRRRIASPMTALVFGPLLMVGSAGVRAHSTDPWDWVVQHVCADTSDHPVPADPYAGCPNGTHERRLKLGDPMPYLRHDQPNPRHPQGVQRHDSYPLADRHFGGVVSADDFDFGYEASSRVIHPGGGDGYDVYRVADGYVSGSGTRDGFGYRTTFFGLRCRPYNGWVFFPASFLRELRPGAGGSGVFPIHGDYYEHNGEPYPGQCGPDTRFGTPLTTWTFEPGFVLEELAARPRSASMRLFRRMVSRSMGGHIHISASSDSTSPTSMARTRWEVWKLAADVSNTPGPAGGRRKWCIKA